MKNENLLETEGSKRLLTDEELDMEVNRILRSIPSLNNKYLEEEPKKEPFVVTIEGLDDEFNTDYNENENGQFEFKNNEEDGKIVFKLEEVKDPKKVEVIESEEVYANDYNPNTVAPKEEEYDGLIISDRARRILAGGVLLLTMGAAIFGLSRCGRENKKADDINTKTKISSENENDKDNNKITIDDIDYDLTFEDDNANTNAAGKTTIKSGNFDINKIVTDEDGTVWVNQEAKDKYNNSKKETKETPKEKVENGGSVVVDKNGKVVSKSDTNEIPAGYHKDSKTGRIIKDGYIVDENGDLIDNSKNIDESNKIGTVVKETFEEVKEDVKEDYEWAAGEYEKYINSKDFNCYVLDGKLYYGTFNLEEFNAKAKSTIKSIKPVVEETYEEVKEEGKEIFEQLEEKVIEKKEEIKEQKEVKEEVKEEKVVEEEVIEEETEAVWAEGEFDKFINSTDFNCYELDGKLYYGTMPEVSKTLVLK